MRRAAGVYVYTAEGRQEYPIDSHMGRIGDLQELVNRIREDRTKLGLLVMPRDRGSSWKASLMNRLP
jgi:hypothetical protein